MKNSVALKTILFICGVIITIAGTFALFSPVAFTIRNGIDIVGNISLLNDYRGTGGLMLGSGLLILSGVFIRKMAFTSTVVASVIYLVFSLGRVLSFLLDGMPTDTLVKATVVEGVLGLLAVFALLKFRDN